MIAEMKLYQVVCDICRRRAGEPRETACDALADADNRGWIELAGGHQCPDCREQESYDEAHAHGQRAH